MKKFGFYNPVEIVFGEGKLLHLNQYVKDRRAIVVTDQNIVQLGYIEQIRVLGCNIVKVLDNIKENPTFQLVEKLYEQVYQERFDVIIAIGGGSVIDSAKILSLYCESKKFKDVKKIIKDHTFITKYQLKPFISIPTTAGTGSEVTPWATIWDNYEKKKYSLHLPDLWSEVCICDPNLTLSLPEKLTLNTALDALSHSLEAIWNKNANPISNNLAISAAKDIIKYLPILMNDLSNIKLRSKIMLSSLEAGLAFSNTKTAIAHAISYYLTLHKQVPHGLACSFTLPDIIDAVIGQNNEIDTALVKIFGNLSSEKLRLIYQQLNISTHMSNYQVTDEELKTLKKSVYETQRIKNSVVNMDKLFEKLSYASLNQY